MPTALLGHAVQSATLPDRPRQNMADAPANRKAQPAICPTDEDAVATKRLKPHKQSLDYVWRTGLAGGLAGCAVCSSDMEEINEDSDNQ
jgi:solute carrier family 25 protein 16